MRKRPSPVTTASHFHRDRVVNFNTLHLAKDQPCVLVCPESEREGDKTDQDSQGQYPVVIARAALEEHPGPDVFPHGLCPGGEVEAGRVPVLVLRHDGAQGRASVYSAP